MAVTRGLLLDLLATRDTKGVTAAFELFLQLGAVAPPNATANSRTRPTTVASAQIILTGNFPHLEGSDQPPSAV